MQSPFQKKMLSILYEIDLRKLLAQCYDGAWVMSGKHGGVQALISQHVKRNVPYIQYSRICQIRQLKGIRKK